MGLESIRCGGSVEDGDWKQKNARLKPESTRFGWWGCKLATKLRQRSSRVIGCITQNAPSAPGASDSWPLPGSCSKPGRASVSGAHHTTIGTDTETMARLRSLLQQVCSLLLLLAVGSHALKFDIQAGSGHDKNSRRCIRNFVSKDMLVVVTAIVDGYKGDGMQLNMHVGATAAMRTQQTRC